MKLLRRILIGGIVVVATLYAALVAGVWAYQDHIMFGRRSPEIVRTPEAENWPYEDVWVEAPDGRTHGWWIPLENARGAVMFSHGNGRNISHHLEDAACFRELGFSVLLYDYGGYGKSTGEPSEARCYADGRAMWAHLVTARGLTPDRIVLVGASMGGGVTSDLAAEVTAGAVILESTFTSIPDAGADTYGLIPWHRIARIQYRNIDKVGRIPCPVLVVHSRDDTVVPFEHGKRLFDAITSPKTFVEIHGAHRAGKFASRDIYMPALKNFLEEHIR